MIIDDIRQHASESAAAGDWDAVAKTLRRITETQPARLCFGVETADALDAAGPRRRAIMTAMQSDPDGRFILAKLAGAGVIWAHPRTVALMNGLIAAKVMEPADRDALKQLSAPVIFYHAAVTADECQKAWTVATTRETVNAQSAKATAVNAWLDALDLAKKTPPEVQAYCDLLLDSSTGNPA